MRCPICGSEQNGRVCSICGTKLPQNNHNNSSKKFYQKTWFVILMLVFFFPIGIALMWLYKREWKLPIKIIITLFWCIAFFAASYGEDTEKQNTEANQDENKSGWQTSPTNIEDFKYYTNGSNLYIQEYMGDASDILVGNSYEINGNEFAVSELQDGTFRSCDAISIIISEGISKIGDSTFNGCDAKYIYLPSTIENKGDSFWSYFHDVEEIYYGGSNEQWNEICQINREDLEVKQIYCDVSINDLGTDEAKKTIVEMIDIQKNTKETTDPEEVKDPNTVYDEDKTSYYFMAQEIVLNYLKSPNSAKFPWNTDEIGFSKNGNMVSVQGYVDAQNSFGAEIRSQWTVQYEITDFDNLLCNPLYVNIDETEVGTYTNLE